MSLTMQAIDDDTLAQITGALSKREMFGVSSYVNDRFEIGHPRQLKRPIRGAGSLTSWPSDPASGVTGTVLYNPKTRAVHYNADGANWYIGRAPGSIAR
jgi:hypothetical protein